MVRVTRMRIWEKARRPALLACLLHVRRRGAENIARGRRAEGQSCLQDWFNGPHRQEIVEEVVGLGSYNKTLTVFTGMESPDEIEDEEGGLEESWAVGFRR